MVQMEGKYFQWMSNGGVLEAASMDKDTAMNLTQVFYLSLIHLVKGLLAYQG